MNIQVKFLLILVANFSLPPFRVASNVSEKSDNSREPLGRNEAIQAVTFVEKIVHNKGRSAKTSNEPHSDKGRECYHCVGR